MQRVEHDVSLRHIIKAWLFEEGKNEALLPSPIKYYALFFAC